MVLPDNRHEVRNFDAHLDNPDDISHRVVSLSAFRQKRSAEKNSILADSISEEKGYEIAQGIVQKYSVPGALLQAFLERQKSQSLDKKFEELHEALLRQREMVSGFPTHGLKAVLASYQEAPQYYYETYILSVAEEYQRRFDAASREEI